jgi:hypothetical protein
MGTRLYARLIDEWVTAEGVRREDYWRGIVQVLDDLEWLFELLGPQCQMLGHILRSGERPVPMVNPYVSSEPDGPVPARNANFTEGPSWYLDPGLGGLIEQ